MIRKDLEIAAVFDLQLPVAELVQRLQHSGHIRVISSNCDNCAVFIPCNKQLSENLFYFAHVFKKNIMQQYNTLW